MSDDQFTKLFKYMQGEFQKVNERFDETDAKIDSYAGAVDTYAKQTETYMQEMLALAHKVDRLEQWIYKIAEATGVKLST
ncbi:MAG: hypothetical protein ACREGA_02195 [Candidatus Saccharimonadales bacterium]